MRIVKWCVGVAMLLAVAVLVACTDSGSGGVSSAGPLAVVLAPNGDAARLSVVDVGTHRVLRTVALRSLCTDIDIETGSGLVVAAQTGGIGDEADNALSIVDPRSGTVRYVSLPFRDPANVVCLDRRAYVLHSIVTTAGLLVSVVDLDEGTVISKGAVPDGPGLWCAAAGAIWTGALREDGGWDLVRVDPGTLACSVVDIDGPPVTGVVAVGEHVVALSGVAPADGSAGAARITVIDPKSLAVVASEVSSDLAHPARLATVWNGRLVVGDWGGQTPETRRLAALDAESFGPRPPLSIAGVPCALSSSGDELLVVERTQGRLLSVGADGGTNWSVDLGTGELPFADLVTVAPRGAVR